MQPGAPFTSLPGPGKGQGDPRCLASSWSSMVGCWQGATGWGFSSGPARPGGSRAGDLAPLAPARCGPLASLSVPPHSRPTAHLSPAAPTGLVRAKPWEHGVLSSHVGPTGPPGLAARRLSTQPLLLSPGQGRSWETHAPARCRAWTGAAPEDPRLSVRCQEAKTSGKRSKCRWQTRGQGGLSVSPSTPPHPSNHPSPHTPQFI